MTQCFMKHLLKRNNKEISAYLRDKQIECTRAEEGLKSLKINYVDITITGLDITITGLSL